MSYDIGDTVTLKADFTDAAGDPVDPSSVTCTIKEPDGTVSEVALTVEGTPTGHYEADFSPTQSGRHYFRFAGTGTVGAAEESKFSVKKQKVVA